MFERERKEGNSVGVQREWQQGGGGVPMRDWLVRDWLVNNEQDLVVQSRLAGCLDDPACLCGDWGGEDRTSYSQGEFPDNGGRVSSIKGSQGLRPDLVTQACESQRVRQEARQALVGKPGLLSQEKRREKQKKDVLGENQGIRLS